MEKIRMGDGAEIAVYHVQPSTKTNDGESEADAPIQQRRGGLILLHEIFGVTDHIRDMADEYAEAGYEVLAPALFDREHPGFESDYSGPDFERAMQLARSLHPFDQSVADAQSCADLLADAGPVFVVGYCYGGSVAWRLAQTSPNVAAASCYYGSLIPKDFADQAPLCATIAHFGRFDAGIPMDGEQGVAALAARDHATAQIFVYEAGHGFNSDRRKDYHPESADLAFQRSLMLFQACGGDAEPPPR
jgi:carboxymethylenebutenolidase